MSNSTTFTIVTSLPTCNPLITMTVTLEDGSPLPDFLTFDSSLLQFSWYTTTNSDLGEYYIKVFIEIERTDTVPPVYIAHEFTWLLTLLPIIEPFYYNQPPFFVTQPKDQVVEFGHLHMYKLPAVWDKQNDNVTMRFDFAEASVFTSNLTVDGDINNTQIKFYTTDRNFINKNFTIRIILDDNNFYYPLKAFYDINVTVVTDCDEPIKSNSTIIRSDNKTYIKARIESISYMGYVTIIFNKNLNNPYRKKDDSYGFKRNLNESFDQLTKIIQSMNQNYMEQWDSNHNIEIVRVKAYSDEEEKVNFTTQSIHNNQMNLQLAFNHSDEVSKMLVITLHMIIFIGMG